MYKNVTMELSLKPFKKTDEAYIRNVCREMFFQWRQLLKACETISVMMWTADGSELLDYSGNMQDEFDWCCWIGNAQCPQGDDPLDTEYTLHQRKFPYMENPPVMTYEILKTIIACIKEEGRAIFPNAKIRVGQTFDLGPEFAVSQFKYVRHPEICTSSSGCDGYGFVDGTAILKGDTRKYAAYPKGIKEGTPFAEFFGKQANIFLKDMDFDYIWLSNGLGFSSDPWKTTGKIYDGENFHPEFLEDTRSKVFMFWELFRKACPDFPIEVRGTNNSVGIDYSSDGVPTLDIYRAGFNITPPPNSPWAAILKDYGLEIMGQMTRVCELPQEDKGFMFRYYIHDPWWINSPWYDRYNGYPTDIYLPSAISRITPEGKVKTADTFSILSVDNSFGDMPDACVNEPLPHLLKAKKDAGDGIAPLVWVYPVKEYCSAKSEQELREMYECDNFIRYAITEGLPLNCVVSTENFLKHNTELYMGSIIISPSATNSEVIAKLEEFSAKGGRVIYYGSEMKAATENKFVSTKEKPSALREALSDFGLIIKHIGGSKTPVMTIANSNNGFFFSVYSPDTNTEAQISMPFGAPILIGGETVIKNGLACYRFPRCDHRECRVFVKQTSGELSSIEMTSGLPFHRRFKVSGLKNATVYYFPEKKYMDVAFAGPAPTVLDKEPAPTFDTSFVKEYDPKIGEYYKAENITGDYCFYMKRI